MLRFVIKGKDLLELGDKKFANAHQLALQSKISYPTANKYVDHPETVKAMDLGMLAFVLLEGKGYTPEQALDLKLGDLFELKETKD